MRVTNKLDFRKGELVRMDDIDKIAIDVYNAVNFLTPENIDTVNTGVFVDEDGYSPVNHCGLVSPVFCGDNKKVGYAISKEIEQIKETLRQYNE